ncbi:MAG: hypothetical protein CO103_02525 [Chloroflexi bacterium CG_4_9_14_3_um_filter_45_9]|nr:MAG: hypothetical protein COT13_05620 [Chloroflexi bacterium CG08_land_8_20_14_0_20_45_12]PJB50394.1 MAG: hypothetical protein CO103_02525 [Chloroflexi bacterium CG_4_9_14_3_um_filter_45_9]
MKRDIVELEDVRTDGLASAYQRTNITTVDVSAVMETGGHMLISVVSVPWSLPFSLTEPSVRAQPNEIEREQDELAKGYRAMAAENKRLAEEYLPVALEEWPIWEDK